VGDLESGEVFLGEAGVCPDVGQPGSGVHAHEGGQRWPERGLRQDVRGGDEEAGERSYPRDVLCLASPEEEDETQGDKKRPIKNCRTAVPSQNWTGVTANCNSAPVYRSNGNGINPRIEGFVLRRFSLQIYILNTVKIAGPVHIFHTQRNAGHEKC